MICINKGKIKNLTVGKDYVVTKMQTGTHFGSDKKLTGLWVINDSGKNHYYSIKRFVEIDIWRDKQITLLINE